MRARLRRLAVELLDRAACAVIDGLLGRDGIATFTGCAAEGELRGIR